MSEFLRISSLTFPLLIAGISLIVVLKRHLFARLNIPLDHGGTLGGKRIFGDHKTYRGVIVLIFACILTTTLLHVMYFLSFSPYIHPLFILPPLFLGSLYILPYILGELINSFIKRRVAIAPGKTAYRLQTFFDLTDGIIVTMLVLVFTTHISFIEAVIAGMLGIIMHIGTDRLMLALRLKQKS